MGALALCQGGFSGFPSAGHEISCGLVVPQGPQLPEDLGDIPSDRRGQNLACLNDPLGIDDEMTPEVKTGFAIIRSEKRTDLSARVGKHRETGAADHDPGKLLFLPFLVRGRRIDTDGQHFGIEFQEGWILDGDRRHLRWSDVCEIGRIKEKNDPLSPVIGKPNGLEGSLMIGLRIEIGRYVSDPNSHFLLPSINQLLISRVAE